MDARDNGSHADAEPRAATVSVITTEHFTLQGARTTTTSEAIGRATMFLSSLSGGLVALGLIATATHVGNAFYVFGLILLPTLAFIGLVTFERTVQSGIEDFGYARRIARLRGYYFEIAPELTPYLLSVSPPERLTVQGLWARRCQGFRTVAGMVAVVTAVLAGAAVGQLAAILSGHSLVAALVAGAVTGIAALVVMMLYQRRAWDRATTAVIFPTDEAEQG
jgi:hypothetical protein